LIKISWNPPIKAILFTLCALMGAIVVIGLAIYIPKYLDEKQAVRDASTHCVNYRTFLLASDYWTEEGDVDQARGVFGLAQHHFKLGKCTKVH
jgi:hypothetical protein